MQVLFRRWKKFNGVLYYFTRILFYFKGPRSSGGTHMFENYIHKCLCI